MGFSLEPNYPNPFARKDTKAILKMSGFIQRISLSFIILAG
jgi:hypothetical protein